MTPAIRPLPAALLAALTLSVSACGQGKQEVGGGTPPTPSAPATPQRPARSEGAACAGAGEGPEPDAAGLRAFVRQRRKQLHDCYQRALKRDDSVGGKATLRFTIGTCGQLMGVEVAERRGKVDEAAACAARALRGWQTPFRPAEPVTVEYPVAFSASM